MLAAAAGAPATPKISAQAQEPARESGGAADAQQKSSADSEKKSGERSPAAAATRPTRAEVFAANSIEGSRYSNRALGLTFEIPNKMAVESAPEASGAPPEISGRGRKSTK